jgi:hypothetical protein
MAAESSAPSAALRGILHVFVAVDWGEAVDLQRARQLVPAEIQALPRRRRTPSSFSYRPPPLHFDLPAVSLELEELGTVSANTGVMVFDFGAVSMALRLPFELTPERLCLLAASLAEPDPLVQKARAALRPLYERLRPAVHNPTWHEELSEEYFVFQLPPGESLPPVAELLQNLPGTTPLLAHLLHLETGPLSEEESAEALRLHLRYGADDLFVPDWAAAVLVDRDCDETLQAIEFANLQLLEFRHIDNRLDESLTGAYRLVHPLTRSWIPFWRTHARPLRVLGELKVEANNLFERTGNALKLVGDPYLARVYRLMATRFHLETWQESIQRKLEVTEGVYQVVSDQAAGLRMEFLEITIIALILIEIVLAFRGH